MNLNLQNFVLGPIIVAAYCVYFFNEIFFSFYDHKAFPHSTIAPEGWDSFFSNFSCIFVHPDLKPEALFVDLDV